LRINPHVATTNQLTSLRPYAHTFRHAPANIKQQRQWHSAMKARIACWQPCG